MSHNKNHILPRYRLLFIYIFLCIICLYPYEFYSFYFKFLPEKTYITRAILVLLTGLICVGTHTNRNNGLLTKIVLIQVFALFINGCKLMNFLPFADTVISILLAVELLLLIDSTIGIKLFFEKYNYWILIMAIMGLGTWIAVNVGLLYPIETVVDRADGREITNYLFSFSKTNDFEIGGLRISGFFDEPGSLAYWGMYALVMNKLFIKKERFEFIIIACLLITFSMGFYFQLILYYFLFYFNLKNVKKTILIGAVIFALFYWFKSTDGTKYSTVYDMTLGRIELAIESSKETNNVLAVDDRADLTVNALRLFKANPWFGTRDIDVRVGNNAYETLALYGVIGTLLLLCPYIYLVIKAIVRKDKELLFGMIVLIAGFTHRPFHCAMLYFFMIYSIVLLSKYRYEEQNSI